MLQLSLNVIPSKFTSFENLQLIQSLFCFSRGDEVLVNKEGGYLVRTKTIEHADGGVFAGRAAFDSPYMV